MQFENQTQHVARKYTNKNAFMNGETPEWWEVNYVLLSIKLIFRAQQYGIKRSIQDQVALERLNWFEEHLTEYFTAYLESAPRMKRKTSGKLFVQAPFCQFSCLDFHHKTFQHFLSITSMTFDEFTTSAIMSKHKN